MSRSDDDETGSTCRPVGAPGAETHSSSSRIIILHHHHRHLFCSLAVLDPRVGHTMDILSPFISVLCHFDSFFHRESCPRLDIVYPGCAWSFSPACTWYCSFLAFIIISDGYLSNASARKVMQSTPSARPSVRPFVSIVYLLNRVTFVTSIFCMCMGHDRSSTGIECQGHRSKRGRATSGKV